MMIIVPVLRTLAQAVLGYILAYALSHGVNVPLEAQNWFVETLMVGGGVAAYTAAVRWLETNRLPALRAVGRVLMLGLSKWQPTGYGPPKPALAAGAPSAGDAAASLPPVAGPTRPDPGH